MIACHAASGARTTVKWIRKTNGFLASASASSACDMINCQRVPPGILPAASVSSNLQLTHGTTIHNFQSALFSTKSAASLSSVSSSPTPPSSSFSSNSKLSAIASLIALMATATATACEPHQHLGDIGEGQRLTAHRLKRPSSVTTTRNLPVDFEPIYSASEVAQNDGKDGRPAWITYNGNVYDVTAFVANHPGGSDKILEAAGSAIEPYWYVYRQHFASERPMRLLEYMVIGRLAEKDQEAIDERMEVIYNTTEDPYCLEPERHSDLIVHTATPMNAEVPKHILTRDYVTPSEIFYIRNHHPVPYLTKSDAENFCLSIDLSAYGKGVLKLSLDDLKKMKKAEVVATLQCSGNRRSDFNAVRGTSGTEWGQGAISTAKWGGVYLRDVLAFAGLKDPISAQEEAGIEHVRFTGLDGMTASIGIEKAVNPYGDCLIAYEMNGKPLPRDHGYPCRAIVPGYAAVRNVKWLSKIEVSKEMAEGPWQRGLNYKILPPCVTDAKDLKVEDMPHVTEAGLYSGITTVKKMNSAPESTKAGDKVHVKLSGWAWAGGGRNVVRVDLTGDGGETWQPANITNGSEQRFGRAWAWVFWEGKVSATVLEDGTVNVASKAVDTAFNVQPESCKHTWNVRGLCNTSWYRSVVKLDSIEIQ